HDLRHAYRAKLGSTGDFGHDVLNRAGGTIGGITLEDSHPCRAEETGGETLATGRASHDVHNPPRFAELDEGELHRASRLMQVARFDLDHQLERLADGHPRVDGRQVLL